MTPVSGNTPNPKDSFLRVSVGVGDLYMLLAWADEGLRGGASPDAHPRARQVIDGVREDMNSVCDAAIAAAAREVRDDR